MKIRNLVALFNCLALFATAATTNKAVIFPGDTAQSQKLVWPATPGLRYTVQQSTNLQSWTTAPGYPVAANGPAQQFVFPTTNQSGFFKVSQLDEQPPSIVTQYPPDGGFAVPRFSNLSFQIADATGINTNSIRLTVGSLGTFALTNAQLTLINNILTFKNGGSIPLGGWGSNITATLIMGDTLGNAGTNIWNFTLEVQPQVASNLFVFGSPHAQRTGQQVGNIPTRSLATRLGPIPMAAGDPWTLALVETNRIELTYTNTAPAFSNNTYISNLTPATTNEIFYRKIISLSDNPAGRRLTLYTTNVSLAEMLPAGSLSISPNSVIYDLTNNVIIPALAYDGIRALGSIGMDTSATLYDSGGVTLSLQQAKFLYTPSLSLSFVTSGARVTRFASSLSGRLETAVIPQLTIAGTLSDTKNYDLYKKSRIVFLGFPGGLPVWVDIAFSVSAEVGYTLDASATLATGIRQNADLSFGVDYASDRSPQIQGAPSLTLDPLETIPFSFVIDGSANAYAKIVPQLDVRVNDLVGLYANVDPSISVDGNANYFNGKLTNADFTLTANADLNVGVSLIGVGNVDPPLATFNLYNYSWTTNYPPPDLTIKKQPQSQNVMPGSSVSFSVDAAATAPIAYQWYFNDVPIPGQTTRTLLLPAVTTNFAGNYQVRLSAGKQITNSDVAQLTFNLLNPDNMWVSDLGYTNLTVHWDAVKGATGYQIEISTSDMNLSVTNIVGYVTNSVVGGLYLMADGNNQCQYSGPVLLIGTPINIVVRARFGGNANLNSPAPRLLGIQLPEPPPPPLNDGTDYRVIRSSQKTFTWPTEAWATSYRLYISPTSQAPWFVADVGNASQYTYNFVKNYFYEVDVFYFYQSYVATVHPIFFEVN
ncbi:MAG: immunoglobulin domain-containing protein [Verrucomicrobiota bacterium]